MTYFSNENLTQVIYEYLMNSGHGHLLAIGIYTAVFI